MTVIYNCLVRVTSRWDQIYFAVSVKKELLVINYSLIYRPIYRYIYKFGDGQIKLVWDYE